MNGLVGQLLSEEKKASSCDPMYILALTLKDQSAESLASPVSS